MLVLIYSVGRFINDSSANLGVLKALGYSQWRISFGFVKFGLVVLISCCVAYCMAAFHPFFYDPLMEHDVKFGFHIQTALLTVALPTIILSAVSVFYAKHRLRKKPLDLIGKSAWAKINKLTRSIQKNNSNKPFLKELKKNVLSYNLSLMIFVGFSALAFSAQIQMAISVIEYANNYVAPIVLTSLGLILGPTTLLISLSFVARLNKKYIVLLKSYGYSKSECNRAILSGYRLVSYVGFMVGAA